MNKEDIKDFILGLKKIIKATGAVGERIFSLETQVKRLHTFNLNLTRLFSVNVKSGIKNVELSKRILKAIQEKKIEETVTVQVKNTQELNKPAVLDQESREFLAKANNEQLQKISVMLAESILKAVDDKIEWPRDPKNPIAVRLSNGKKFYDAIMEVISRGGGGVFPFLNANGSPKQGFVNMEGRQEVVVTETAGADPKSIIIDETDPDNVYIGKVLPGQVAVTSEDQWRILRIHTDGVITTIGYANGSQDYNQVWDTRASHTYT